MQEVRGQGWQASICWDCPAQEVPESWKKNNSWQSWELIGNTRVNENQIIYIERLFETLCFWACMLFHVISIRPWPRIYPARFAAAMVHAIPASKWTRSSFAMNAACLLKLPVLSLT